VFSEQEPQYLVECLWPGVSADDLRLLDTRADASVTRLSQTGETVRYLGSLLVREDEVVFCMFEGEPPAITRAAEEAEIPFGRILEAIHSPWSETGAGSSSSS
jgi:hypothetical protein